MAVNIVTVGWWIGHSEPSVTYKIYAKVVTEPSEKVSEMLGLDNYGL
jgi:hypothetical protein